MAADNHGAQAVQQFQIVPHPFADVLDKFQEGAMLECDHDLISWVSETIVWNVGNGLRMSTRLQNWHARRLVWFQKGPAPQTDLLVV